MRNPPDDAAGQPASRRRGQHGSTSGGHRAAESSVFVPGYDNRREPGHDRHAPGQSDPGAPWLGSAAGGSAGKGPVRGYPPLPGQPLPMYPPGQFAAWNRGPSGQDRQPGAASPPNPAGPQASGARQIGQPPAGRHTGSGYYGRDGGQDAEPGYSVLAVSDPAADVTSTQTWQAVGDGRATGTWTSPPMRGESPGRDTGPGRLAGGRGPGVADADARPGRHSSFETGTASRQAAGPGSADQALVEPETATGARGTRLAPWSPQAIAQRTADAGQPSRADTRPGRVARAASHAAGSATAPVSRPQPGTRVADGPAAPGRGAAGGRRAARSGKAGAPRPRKARPRRYPLSAIFGTLLLLLFAGAALYLGARLTSSPSKSAAGHPAKPRTQATATPTPTPTLGPYGHIGSRQQDPSPLTIAQLYPASFTAAGASFARTSSRLSGDCVDALVGANIQSAVSSASCSQAARATYLSAQRGMMGTIGVLNLRSAKAATKAANAAGASNFIAQLTGKSGPTHKIGRGTGIEEAAAKGHYLILIWAELTDRRRPKASQRPGLEQFMTELLQNTANVSLTNRMVNGTPA